MAEWLGNGLQHHLQRFESARHLHNFPFALRRRDFFSQIISAKNNFGHIFEMILKIIVMKKYFLIAAMSGAALIGCKKENTTTSANSPEMQTLQYQTRQLEIERQKLAIEQEKIAFETKRKEDSVAQVRKAESERAAAQPKTVERTVVYRDRPVYVNSGGGTRASSNSGGTYAGTSNSGTTTTTTTQKKGMSKAAKGAIIGTVGGAAAGAIISRKNPGLGAVIGGVVGGATGYGIGRAGDRKDGRVP